MLNKEIFNKPFWSLPVDDVLKMLEANRDGITEEEAVKRRKIFGLNVLKEKEGPTGLRIFFRQFKSPLIFILVVAGFVTLFLKSYKDAAFIFAAVIANVIFGFYQEYKAEAALANLKTYIKQRVRVIRGGREFEIAVEELAPGDIVRLYPGDRIPADSRVIYAGDFFVDEAILTGESLPVEKNPEPVGEETDVSDRTSMLFAGTSVSQGVCHAVVCLTGGATEIGKIASLVANGADEETPLQRSIKKFSIVLAGALGAAFLVLFFAGIYLGYSTFEMFLISVAMAVSAVPEGLPVALTVILAVGVRRLSKRNGVVRKLLAAETLGSASVILTDKTGTLTAAKMTLANVIACGHVFNENELLEFSLLNTNVLVENPQAAPEEWQISGRAIEVALVKNAALKGIFASDAKKAAKILGELPFNSLNKFSASLLHWKGKYFLLFLGAPEILLADSRQPLKKDREKIAEMISEMAYAGERVLGVAFKEEKNIADFSFSKTDLAKNLNFLGLISFRDPVRKSVPAAVKNIAQAGIKTVIVTGDHRGTAEAVARELGFELGSGSVIEGADLQKMTVEDLLKSLPPVRIFARVSPEDKSKIVEAFQRQGEIVAVTGDGVNDAPSLKKADIGVAMGSGTDVTKDVADMVILDDNFETIVAAVEEGRRMLENIKKVIVYLLSSVFDELFLIGGALVMGLPLPLNALQILWVNFISDSFPAIALAFENHGDDLGKRPAKMGKYLLDSEMRFLILVAGTLSSGLLFLLYYILLAYGFDGELVRTFIFAAFGLYSLFLIFSVRSLRRSIFEYNLFSNPYLLYGVGIGFVMMAAAIYLPAFQAFLKTVPLPLPWAAGVVGIGLLNVAAIEIGKYFYRDNR